MNNDHDLKHTEVIKKWNVLQWPCQSLDLNPAEHGFDLQKQKHHKNQQELKTVVKALQSIRKETQHLVMFLGSGRLLDVIDYKGFATKY